MLSKLGCLPPTLRSLSFAPRIWHWRYCARHQATAQALSRTSSNSARIISSTQQRQRHRRIHSTRYLQEPPAPEKQDRGPPSQEQTQTDFAKLDVLGNAPPPATTVDACLPDGFLLGNDLKIRGGSGCFLLNGEALLWRPWQARPGSLLNANGQWECDDEAWGALGLVWPRPDLLILGLGASTHPLSPRTRSYLNSLGVRTEVQDTRNAAAQFNLLATERGVGEVAAALVPIGRRES